MDMNIFPSTAFLMIFTKIKTCCMGVYENGILIKSIVYRDFRIKSRGFRVLETFPYLQTNLNWI